MVIEILIILYDADLKFINYKGPVYSKSYALRHSLYQTRDMKHRKNIFHWYSTETR